ncbi:MAG: methyltransferase [Devosia sp.]|uniref:tRNA1(Val) (adenine(37)-N6)-methyltransferase n=1 Tax=Devosia sp. TaxID=1871048 RepID=UPI0024C74131|nr:methyltransferase [Devosia sp.]UYN99578.1 MAG: methyltransferase [Devosia sp.]
MSLDQPTQFVKHQTISRDAFLGGRLRLSQPRNGFRAGQDSVLLGAAVPKGTDRLLDLGAGVGTAGLVALELGLAAGVDLAERDRPTLALAETNVADNGFSGRAHVLSVDIGAPAGERRAAGLLDNGYDCVIANPPYFREGQGTLAPQEARAGARHMQAEGLALWTRRAAGCAAASGQVIFIYPAEGLAALLSAMQNRFGALTILPLASRPGQAANRILMRGIKGARSPLTLLAPRALHGDDGHGFAPEFDAIFRGKAALDW